MSIEAVRPTITSFASFGVTLNDAHQDCDSTYHIERMKFGTRIAEQIGNICEALRVLEAKDISAVADGPVFTLFAKHALAYGRDITFRD
jgi:hypothetical protein